MQISVQLLVAVASCFAGEYTAIDETCWRLVRHLPPSDSWHPATDRLAGTETYGNPNDNSAPWSVTFGTFDEFLFATGDAKKWLVASKASVIGQNYSDAKRNITKSSISAAPYSAVWYNRAGNTEDPWISLTDHVDAIYSGGLLYGEASFNATIYTSTIRTSGGMKVLVRSTASGPCRPTTQSQSCERRQLLTASQLQSWPGGGWAKKGGKMQMEMVV